MRSNEKSLKPKLLIATQNSGKLDEFSALLADIFDITSAISPPHVLENGTTYFENASKKALSYFETCQSPVLSDDSGLEVDVLKGAPGLLSARFGGERLSWSERWNFLYQQLRPYPVSAWSARFCCVLCYYDGNSEPQFFEGVVPGKIAPAPKGEKGFGYDPIFYCSSLGKTFGEASREEKDQVSHRAIAAKSFLRWWVDHSKA